MGTRAAPFGEPLGQAARLACLKMGGWHRNVLGAAAGLHRSCPAATGAAMRGCYGDFAIARDARQLLRGEEEVHLGPKAYDLLDLLLKHRPVVVPKEKIRDRLWPSTFVSESTLLTVVTDLRTALDD